MKVSRRGFLAANAAGAASVVLGLGCLREEEKVAPLVAEPRVKPVESPGGGDLWREGWTWAADDHRSHARAN